MKWTLIFFDDNLSGVAAMAVGLHKFESARLADELFCVLRALVIEDVFLWHNPNCLAVVQQH